MIVDSGDTMDHGTAAENGFLDPVADLGAPYVWVRGNHDSAHHPALPGGRMKNVHVLDDGEAVTRRRAALRGHRATRSSPPTARSPPGGDPAEELAGGRLASALRDQQAAGTPVDIAVAHNPTAARETDGEVPLVLAGHVHHRENEILQHGTRLRIEGSTGGGGLRAVREQEARDRSRPRCSTWTATPGGSRPGTRSRSAAWA